MWLHGGVGRGAVTSRSCSGLASRRVVAGLADLLLQQTGVGEDADPAMPSPGELGRIASPAPSTSSSSSSCPTAFPVVPAVTSAATSAPVAVATVASKPSASGEKPCDTVKQSNADLQHLRHNCKKRCKCPRWCLRTDSAARSWTL